MSRAVYPSDERDQYMVRFPDGLRDEIKAASEANLRSMNSEIIHRLLAFEPAKSAMLADSGTESLTNSSNNPHATAWTFPAGGSVEAKQLFSHSSTAKGPAEVFETSPSHGPTTPTTETAMDAASNTTAPAGPATGDAWFGRACDSDDALRHIGIIASAASCALIQNSSRKGTSADFEITEAALDDATAFLRAIEDIVAQARRDA